MPEIRAAAGNLRPRILALPGPGVLAQPVDPKVVQAQKAYDFVDSLGVVTHVNRGKGVLDDSGWATISDAIAEAGFRYVRTTVINDEAVQQRITEMEHQLKSTEENLQTTIEELEQHIRPGLWTYTGPAGYREFLATGIKSQEVIAIPNYKVQALSADFLIPSLRPSVVDTNRLVRF